MSCHTTLLHNLVVPKASVSNLRKIEQVVAEIFQSRKSVEVVFHLRSSSCNVSVQLGYVL